MEDDFESDDPYIWYAIHALNFLRKKTDVDQQLKDFTHIVKQMIITMKEWEDVKNYEECCCLILLALEEWEKRDFVDSGSIMMRGHFRSMMGELRYWIKTS